MKTKLLALLGCLVLFTAVGISELDAGRYTRWHRRAAYYFSYYYYAPARYHYVIYYAARPRYVYYYNPYKRLFWGRLDLEGEPGQQYSLLAEEDRRANLEEIPESAFPQPGPMPAVPESDGSENIEPPPAPPKGA